MGIQRNCIEPAYQRPSEGLRLRCLQTRNRWARHAACCLVSNTGVCVHLLASLVCLASSAAPGRLKLSNLAAARAMLHSVSYRCTRHPRHTIAASSRGGGQSNRFRAHPRGARRAGAFEALKHEERCGTDAGDATRCRQASRLGGNEVEEATHAEAVWSDATPSWAFGCAL